MRTAAACVVALSVALLASAGVLVALPVLALGASTPAAPVAASIPVGAYALPLAVTFLNAAVVQRHHHDYPAVDIPVPVGAAAFAVAAGTIIAAGDDGERCGGTVVLLDERANRFVYCHASQVLVEPGQYVQAGELILRTGGAPGEPGAGDSTGPHLHFGVNVAGRARCPQPLLLAWLAAVPLAPEAAPATGCIY